MRRSWVPDRRFGIGCVVGFLLGSVGLAAAVLGGGLLFKDQLVAHKATQLKTPPVPLGRAADYNWQLEGAGGDALDFATLRGKVVFLHFWAPNCIHCLPELPSVNALHQTTDPEQVSFVCVAVGGFDSVKAFLHEEGLAFPAYVEKGPVPDTYGLRGPPATFILSRDGRVVFEHHGPARWDGADVRTYLRRLTAEPMPDTGRTQPSSS